MESCVSHKSYIIQVNLGELNVSAFKRRILVGVNKDDRLGRITLLNNAEGTYPWNYGFMNLNASGKVPKVHSRSCPQSAGNGLVTYEEVTDGKVVKGVAIVVVF